ncbi:MAG: hypothetical protein CMH54_13670 [Myxococcales bacterium]|nr:hypothetical protein [Myxococcales bacterium]
MRHRWMIILASLLLACSGSSKNTDTGGDGASGDALTDANSDAVVTAEQQLILDVPVSETWSIPGLQDNAYVVRTEMNVPHIYASNRNDLGRILGFNLGRDRFFVMDLVRRMGLGTISELLGDAALENDQESRGLGMPYLADRLLANVSDEMAEYLDAFADGMNSYIDEVEKGNLPPPSELAVAYSLLGADSPTALMHRWDRRSVAGMVAVVMYETTFETGDVSRTQKFAALDNLYPESVPYVNLRRHGFLTDVAYNVTPLFPDSSAEGLGLELGEGQAAGPSPTEPGADNANPPQEGDPSDSPSAMPHPIDLIQRLAQRLERFDLRIQRNRRAGFGSNAWAVAGSASTDGSALVAGDGHLQLSIPSLMYQVALDTQLFGGGDIHQIGLLLTGLPVLAVGTNGHVAWSQVNPVFDITDWYLESIQLDADGMPATSEFQGEWKSLIAVEESIDVAHVDALDSVGRTETWTRWTTFDGRWISEIEGRNASEGEVLAEGESIINIQGNLIVPGDTDGDGVISAISFDYAAFDATNYMDALDNLGRTNDVYEFRDATRGLVGSGLFSAVGDSSGNILFTSYQAVPCRTYLPRTEDGDWAAGANPMALLDGRQYGGFELPMVDGRADEGTEGGSPNSCVIPFDEMPQAINPDQGYVATANNDPGNLTTDGSLSNDQWYLGGPWSSVRVNTIGRELAAAIDSNTADLAAMMHIQGNKDSRLGELFAPPLVVAIGNARVLSKSSDILSSSDQRLADLYSANEAAFDEAQSYLINWADANYRAASGVQTFYETPTETDLQSAVATSIFNAYIGRFINQVWNDEPVSNAFLFSADRMKVRMTRTLLDGRGEDNSLELASHNADTGESVFFDRIGTEELERSDELMLTALAEGLDFLRSEPQSKGVGGFGVDDMSQWLWGLRHMARFESLLGSFLGNDPALAQMAQMFSITTLRLPLDESITPDDPRYGLTWFPRGGDQWNVDAANPGLSSTDSSHGNGPVMRMVIALNEGNVSGHNIVPGGQSGLTDSDHFADQLELWLANDTIPMRFHVGDVAEGATGREVYTPSDEPIPTPPDTSSNDTGAIDAGGTDEGGAPEVITTDTGTTDEGSPDEGTPDEGSPDEGSPEPDISEPVGACNNDLDNPFFDADNGQQNIENHVDACAMENFLSVLSGNLVNFTNCIIINAGLSFHCAECYAAETDCRYEACFDCIADPGGAECAACSTACAESFAACSGRAPVADDCSPDCTDKACGSNGCGGSCGSCDNDSACTSVGQCQALPTDTANLDCQHAFLCLMPCGGDGDCTQACFDAHPKGMPVFVDMEQCVGSNCGDQPAFAEPGYGEWQQCSESAKDPDGVCATETSACVAGEGNCIDLRDCLFSCFGDPNCPSLCFWSATLAAQELYDAVNNCINTNCSQECGAGGEPGACPSCQVANCSPEMLACEADAEE